jgi:hypothetical protein
MKHQIKLTKSDHTSLNGVAWYVGSTVEIPEGERGTKLYRGGMLHVYEGSTAEGAVVLGLMLDPIHDRIGDGSRAKLVRGEIVARDGQIKAGGHKFEVIQEIEVPKVTTEMRVRFSILCAQAVVRDAYPKWSAWAERWLSRDDRSWRSAAEADRVVMEIAPTAMDPAAWAALAASTAAAAEAASWAAMAITRNASRHDVDLSTLALRAIHEESTCECG